MTVYTTLDSPLGELLLVGEPRPGGGVALDSLTMAGQKGAAVIQEGWLPGAEPFAQVSAQLDAYFRGALTRFDVDTTTRGSDFQQRVWRALEDIPYGATTSYGAIAASIGASRAAVRAVGTAIGANPVCVIRPCHRVIGADGSLTGYAGGLDRKQHLLSLEQGGAGSGAAR